MILLETNTNTGCFSVPSAPSTSGTNPESKYAGNSIEDVPSSICNLVCLKSLSLNGNKIRQVFALDICWCSVTKLITACHPTSTLHFQLPQNLLKDCTALQSISLHDNPITMDQFQQVISYIKHLQFSSILNKLVLIIVPFNFFHLLQMNGFNEFEARRRKKFDKQIDSRVMMGSTALDEGVDFH